MDKNKVLKEDEIPHGELGSQSQLVNSECRRSRCGLHRLFLGCCSGALKAAVQAGWHKATLGSSQVIEKDRNSSNLKSEEIKTEGNWTQLMEDLRCQREADEKMQRLAKAESHYHPQS